MTTITDCECIQAGICNRHRCYKTPQWVHLCKTRRDYFNLWERGTGPGQDSGLDPDNFNHIAPTSSSFTELPESVGNELHSLLAKFGLKEESGCSCTSRIQEMNRNGIEWCESNIETIVGWLREEASKRKIPFSAIAARVLIRLSIRKARKHGKEAK